MCVATEDGITVTTHTFSTRILFYRHASAKTAERLRSKDGLAPGLTAAVGSATATEYAVTAGQMLLAAPPALGDGPQNVTLTDPVSASSSTMTGALTYGAAASDTIVCWGRD